MQRVTSEAFSVKLWCDINKTCRWLCVWDQLDELNDAGGAFGWFW